MYCIKCGTKNEEDSKFCINCGEELVDSVEETKDDIKEKIKDPIEELKNKRNEFIEHKYDAKNDDVTGVKINGKEIEVEVDKSPSVSTSSTNTSNGSNKAVIIVVIIIGSMLLLGLLAFAGYSIYTQFFKENIKTIKTIKPSTPPKTPTTPPTKVDDWEIDYTIPEELEVVSESSTLKMYKYQKDGIMCSLHIWKLTYVEDGETEESLITKYSQVYPKDKINVTTKKINGKEWKYIEDKGTWNKYEYGRFAKDKESFYSIRSIDYDPDEGKCRELFDKVINSISYK